MFYGQNAEDCLLWEFFNHKSSGFYIDVGAFDGKYLSNTYWFEQQGWSGICVEPFPTYFDLCKKNRPNAMCIHAACVDTDAVSQVTLYTEPMGILSSIHSIQENEVRRRYEGRKLEFSGYRAVIVPAKTLNALVKEWLPSDAQIDFVSIDVEGAELQVLQGFNLVKHRPRLMLIEANTAAALQQLNDYLTPYRYQLVKVTSGNAWYVHNRSDRRLLQSLDVDCGLAKSLHPMGQQYTPAYHQAPRSVHISAENQPSLFYKLKNFVKRVKQRLAQGWV